MEKSNYTPKTELKKGVLFWVAFAPIFRVQFGKIQFIGLKGGNDDVFLTWKTELNSKLNAWQNGPYRVFKSSGFGILEFGVRSFGRQKLKFLAEFSTLLQVFISPSIRHSEFEVASFPLFPTNKTFTRKSHLGKIANHELSLQTTLVETTTWLHPPGLQKLRQIKCMMYELVER